MKVMKFLALCFLVVIFSSSAFADGDGAVDTISKGLQVGGAGAGAPGVAAVGVVVDILGGIFGSKRIDKESEQYKNAIRDSWELGMKVDILTQNRKLLKPTADTTSEQVKAHAVKLCGLVDKTVAEGGYWVISRKDAKENFALKHVLPDGDGDIKYKLTKNPVDNCVVELAAAAGRMVEAEKKKVGR